MSFLRSNLVRGSVRTADVREACKTLVRLHGSAHLKNIEPNSSGGGTVDGGGFLLRMLEITADG